MAFPLRSKQPQCLGNIGKWSHLCHYHHHHQHQHHHHHRHHQHHHHHPYYHHQLLHLVIIKFVLFIIIIIVIIVIIITYFALSSSNSCSSSSPSSYVHQIVILITKLMCLHSWWLAVIWKNQHMTTVSHTRENTHTHTHSYCWTTSVLKKNKPHMNQPEHMKKTLYESFYRLGKQRQPCTFEWCTWNNTHDFAHIDKENAIDISWRLTWIWLHLQEDFESSCDI